MEPKNFVQKYYPIALKIERETEIPALALCAQWAFESGWGDKAIGYNLFGVKFKKGDFGYIKRLTTEHSKNPNAFQGKEIKSKIWDKEHNDYKFKIFDYFADYETQEKAFEAHTQLLLSKRYKHCLRWNHSPKRYIIAVWRSGYATQPDYPQRVCPVVDSIKKRI